MNWTPYCAHDYIDFPAVEAFCRDLAAAHPEWVHLETAGESRHGRPILLLTIGDLSSGLEAANNRPSFWLDGGTHAAEWTGVMSVLYTVSHWIEGLVKGDDAICARFAETTAVVMPCISPDGFQAMCEGSPFIRSSLRPPAPGTSRTGFTPKDLDGDGTIRWMRWADPCGPWVADETVPLLMRPRQIDDPADKAFFVATEGEFINWDGVQWTAAGREFGHDLNRNFPADWKPFSMFGMDSGKYPTSEPESRAVVASFSERPYVAAAVTNHTYTGCLLTSPSRMDTPLGAADISLMYRLGKEAIEGTGYTIYKIHPDFEYDPKKPTVGVWSDAMVTTFGVAAYTLELWNPYEAAGVEMKEPAKFFSEPDAEIVRELVKCFGTEAYGAVPWTSFDHPQLGPVEIGGIDYMRTIRNPPVALLREECERGLKVHERVFKALPKIKTHTEVTPMGEGVSRVRVTLENQGFLSTSSLARGEAIGASGPVTIVMEGEEPLDGLPGQTLEPLDGWGNRLIGFAGHAIYPNVGDRGHRKFASWLVRTGSSFKVTWHAGRAGCGELTVET